VSSYWFNKSWQWMSGHPGDYLVLLGRKALIFFNPEEFDQMGLGMEFVRHEYGTIINLPLPGFAALFMLACIGIVIGVRKKLPVIIPAAVFIGLYLGSLVFFVNGRIRLPVYPVLALFGGLAVDRVIAVLRERDGRSVLSIVLPAAAAMLVVMVPSRIPQSWDQEYIRLGQIAFDKRNASGAQKYFELSLEQRKTVQGLTNLGNAYAAQGRAGQAENCYAEALRLDASWPLLHFNLGNLLYQQGRRDQAEVCWKRAVELQPGLAPAWLNLGLAAYTQGRLEDALKWLTKAHEFETDPKVRSTIERDMAALQDRLKAR
jgi:Tfp pilus assembly protein PilF